MFLEAHKLTKAYASNGRRVEVLRGCDLSIEKGEMVAIVGASGVGKSTLMHVLGSLDVPDSGTVHLGGKALFELSEHARTRLRNETIGFVFQFHYLLPEFTAAENVAMPLMIGRMERAEALRRAEKLLADLGLSERGSHLPSQLSGGEQQRVAVARALVTEPTLVLADEPTGNLDTANSEELVSVFRHLHEERDLTSVIVTHSRDVALVCDRTFYMEEGRLRI
ncbi:MAG: ABC transporter ATP-binding protein [Acidobacteria bacterium]|nr:MAG: ABC transporter ATP-binding protein [Acidobacteriota bacterium]